jgi:hypothetical protein
LIGVLLASSGAFGNEVLHQKKNYKNGTQPIRAFNYKCKHTLPSSSTDSCLRRGQYRTSPQLFTKKQILASEQFFKYSLGHLSVNTRKQQDKLVSTFPTLKSNLDLDIANLINTSPIYL